MAVPRGASAWPPKTHVNGTERVMTTHSLSRGPGSRWACLRARMDRHVTSAGSTHSTVCRAATAHTQERSSNQFHSWLCSRVERRIKPHLYWRMDLSDRPHCALAATYPNQIMRGAAGRRAHVGCGRDGRSVGQGEPVVVRVHAHLPLEQRLALHLCRPQDAASGQTQNAPSCSCCSPITYLPATYRGLPTYRSYGEDVVPLDGPGHEQVHDGGGQGQLPVEEPDGARQQQVEHAHAQAEHELRRVERWYRATEAMQTESAT